MALDKSKYRLIPMTSIGRAGLQGRAFALGTSDVLSEALAPGYIDDIAGIGSSADNRTVFGGDLVFLNHDVETPGNAGWLQTVVSWDASKDTYTLTPEKSGGTFTFVQTGAGGDDTEVFSGLDGVKLGMPVIAAFYDAPAEDETILRAEATGDGKITVTYSKDPGLHQVSLLVCGNRI